MNYIRRDFTYKRKNLEAHHEQQKVQTQASSVVTHHLWKENDGLWKENDGVIF